MIIEGIEQFEVRYPWERFIWALILPLIGGFANKIVGVLGVLVVLGLAYWQKSRQLVVTKEQVVYKIALDPPRIAKYAEVVSVTNVDMTQSDLGGNVYTNGPNWYSQTDCLCSFPG